MHVPSSSTGVTITNPLILYRALLATKRIDPDPAQHRLALHLQTLYERLKDYEPIFEYNHRLNQISKALGSTPGSSAAALLQDATPATWRGGKSILSSLFEQKRERDSLALTRVLTSHEAAKGLESPKGLMLHGEVGTGKSMLIDLFADCLPNRKKLRIHYNTFMLETMSKLEQLRRSRLMIVPASLAQQEEYSLLWLAREMITKSPILFLDEFQLPDRAASKIITNLMTSFFHLGGVLIATSNRMPEELAKAAGMDFMPPPSRLDSLGWRFGIGGKRAKGKSESMFSGQGDFAQFLDVLKARCEVWEMGSEKDYRRRESEVGAQSVEIDDAAREEISQGLDGLEGMASGYDGLGHEQSRHVMETPDTPTPAMFGLPRHYFVKPSPASSSAEEEQQWDRFFSTAQSQALGLDPTVPVPWTTGTMRVYGRQILVPHQSSGVTRWTFSELCASTLGPADYITLASTYHTLILTDVPILDVLSKNEARRFITLLDALYEARCKLIITADAGPDDIFFPEPPKTASENESMEQDAVYPETFSEVYQDATAPFRPNISMYDVGAAAPVEPNFAHSRFAGFFADDQLEDDPPNTPHRAFGNKSPANVHHDTVLGSSGTSLDERDVRGGSRAGSHGPDFSRSDTFTGEDERFAYKRARSRLWEMCGNRWWGRSEEGWWKPVDKSVRRWEGNVDDVAAVPNSAPDVMSEVSGRREGMVEGVGESRNVDETMDEVMFRHSPSWTGRELPPKISDTHVWGVMKWGKKAGAWGKGVEGLVERKRDRDGEGGGGKKK